MRAAPAPSDIQTNAIKPMLDTTAARTNRTAADDPRPPVRFKSLARCLVTWASGSWTAEFDLRRLCSM